MRTKAQRRWRKVRRREQRARRGLPKAPPDLNAILHELYPARDMRRMFALSMGDDPLMPDDGPGSPLLRAIKGLPPVVPPKPFGMPRKKYDETIERMRRKAAREKGMVW